MALVMNKTARQFNLKCIGPNKKRTVVRLVPGLNNVLDEHWGEFVSAKHTDSYVTELKKGKLIDYGSAVDEMEMETDDIVDSKSKSEPTGKGNKK